MKNSTFKRETNKKEKFIKSTIILVIGGFFTKLLGLFIRIVVTRLVGDEGISLYMLVLPTFLLFITLAQLGFPIAISKLVSEDKKNNKKLLFSIIPIALVINIILVLILFLMSPYLSVNLLHDSRTYFPLICSALVLPFISISGILRGYFFGKERMFPHVISNLCEQIVRLVVLILILPGLLSHSLEYAIGGIALVSIISEVISIIILILFLPRKKFKIKELLVIDKENVRDVLRISIPTTSSRLVGSFGYFLEPIILTFVLMASSYSQDFIALEYGIITGYVISLLMIPSFFTTAISSALLPVISKEYSNKNYKSVKRKLKQALLLSISIGLVVTVCFVLEPGFFLNLVYNTDKGAVYLKILSPVFLLYYIQVPLTYTLQAMGRAKEAMKSTIVGVLVKTILLFVLSFFGIGLYSLIIALSVNIIIVTYSHYKKIKSALR